MPALNSGASTQHSSHLPSLHTCCAGMPHCSRLGVQFSSLFVVLLLTASWWCGGVVGEEPPDQACSLSAAQESCSADR